MSTLSDFGLLLHEHARSVGRVEANQRMLLESHQSLRTRLDAHGEALGEIKAGQRYTRSGVNMILASHGEALGRIESKLDGKESGKPRSLAIAETVFEIAMKIASHWAPISAAGVAFYKFVWPSVRPWLLAL